MQAQHIEFLQLLNGTVQYVVPRWQRRYCWQQSDIEGLVDDLLAIADAAPHSTHYAGTLLTFPEPGAAGVLTSIRVVDGQQRLTTISILLACIAAKLRRDGPCGEWTSEIIREDRLTNGPKYPKKRLKLRLQSGDQEEYRRGIDGNPEGTGAVTQAWRIARRLVERCETARLLTGLKRLRVVSIGLDHTDDPQQIFQSINSTGRPLTESEKVKNWLLIGLSEAEQQELHDTHWRKIEQVLGAGHSTEPIDMFLRDVMRWRTGVVQGGDKTYEQMRRWALKHGHADRRPDLCRELAHLAQLYGILTGAAEPHPVKKVETELRHMRELGLHVHRPLTLRLLDEASGNHPTQVSNEELLKAIAGIGTWITRLWLADLPTAGMNSAVAELAYTTGSCAGEDYAEHWLDRIRSLRNRSIGVPQDEEVREGIRTRKAYGGSATRSAFAVLCELMEAEQPSQAPKRSYLTIEHVMPQTLTAAWKSDLGKEADEIHSQYRHRFANLTLSGDVVNSGMGTKTFSAKRKVYRESSIGMTRRIAEMEWSEDALSKRAEEIACKALERWPWHDQGIAAGGSQNREAPFRWRIEDGLWHTERVGSRMVLNVTGALLSMSPANTERLQGEAISANIHPASRYRPGRKVGSILLSAVPRHEDWVLNPYAQNDSAYAERCRKLGERCEVRVQVKLGSNVTERFWRFLQEKGGITGQKPNWRGGIQWASSGNAFGDWVGFYVGNPDRLWLYIKAGNKQPADHVARMRRLSQVMLNQMEDQSLSDDWEAESQNGKTIKVMRHWTRDNEDEWDEACRWLQDQCQRLMLILADSDQEVGEPNDDE